MKYLKQILIILVLSLVAEAIKALLPAPIPASIYGMILLLVGLLTGIIKLESIRETGYFLINIMPVLFVSTGVGLMTSYDTLRPIILPAIIITVVSLLTVMLATGRISQFIIRKRQKNEEKRKHE